MESAILQLSIIVSVAAVLGIVLHMFRQPPFLAYIFAGVGLGTFGVLTTGTQDLFQTFSSLGIMLLLFLIGMEINYDSLRLVGKTSLILGLSQILFTSSFGFLIAVAFGFSKLSALYIGIALTFSSTIIIIKLLSERKQIHSLHGKISIGFLLVQDFVAMLILMVLAGTDIGGSVSYMGVGLTVLKGVGLFILMLFLGRKIIPPILDKIAQSLELLFLTTLAWALGVAVAVSYVGFSIEIGGFLAGLALANSSEHFQISARIKSLRDFFILIFFVTMGSSLIITEFSQMLVPVIVFSLFVLIGNPIIVIALMGLMGYRKKTSFMAGITVAQISEFSLIVVALGFSLEHIPNSVVSLVTAVGVITIVTSTYIITYSEKIFSWLKPRLDMFEKKSAKITDFPLAQAKPIIIIGGHRIGKNIASMLAKKDMLIVDFDPDLVEELEKEGLNVLFGDISDEEIQEQAQLSNAKLIISSSPDFVTNEGLLQELKALKKGPLVIVRAETIKDAQYLYKKGADYVILPHLTAGRSLGRALSGSFSGELLEELRDKDLLQIKNSTLKI